MLRLKRLDRGVRGGLLGLLEIEIELENIRERR